MLDQIINRKKKKKRKSTRGTLLDIIKRRQVLFYTMYLRPYYSILCFNVYWFTTTAILLGKESKGVKMELD